MRRLPLVFVLGLALTCGSVSAGTPDGETPAEESVCDDLKWSTPGLYGLCVAFCEAQDCEPDFSMENPLAHCKPASQRILDNYRKRMQPGDPDMPCIQAPCPCWSAEELDLLWPPVEGHFYNCTLDATDGSTMFNVDSFEDASPTPGAVPGYNIGSIEELVWPETTGPACGFFFREGDIRINRIYFITYDEFLVCEEQVDQKGAELGYDCFLP